MGNGLLILVLGSMMTMLFVSTTFVKTKQGGFDNSMSYYEDNYTRNMANSMINMLLTRLAEDFEYREEGAEKEILDGVVEYKVLDTVMIRRNGTWTGPPGQEDKNKDKFQEFWSYDTTGTDTVIKIEVVARFNKYENKSTAYTIAGRAGGWVPPVVRGAWTANGPLNNTISDMYIDGRNHDLNLNIVPNTGTRAISTSVEFTNIENAAIGGTSTDSTDYILSYPEDPNVIEENYNWGGTFPETPDEILGYPEGTLKKLGQSGEMGSQYLLNPSKSIEDDLNFPLSGVTFIEITDGQERALKMDGTGGKQNGGILVIHGPGTQAKITGLKMDFDEEKTKIKDGGVVICHHPGMPDQLTMTADPAGEMDDTIVPTISGDIDIETDDIVKKGANLTFELKHKKIKKCEDYNGQTVRVYIDGAINNLNLSDCEFNVNVPGTANILNLRIDIPKGELGLKANAFAEYEWEFGEAILSLEDHLAHGDQLDDCPKVTDARFTGLIITDYSFHHHLDILGAVLQLSPNLEESKNCNGNLDHWVYYSQEAIIQATEVTAVLSRELGNSNVRVYDVAGYGSGRQKASYYYE